MPRTAFPKLAADIRRADRREKSFSSSPAPMLIHCFPRVTPGLSPAAAALPEEPGQPKQPEEHAPDGQPEAEKLPVPVGEEGAAQDGGEGDAHGGFSDKIGAMVADRIADRLSEADIGPVIDDLVWEGVQEYRKNPLIALFLNESAVDSICAKVEKALRNYVNGDGRNVIRSLVAEEARRLSDKPLGELAEGFGVDRQRVKEAVGSASDRFIVQFAASFTERTDIGGIVREKIEEMDVVQLEELIMSVMKRELQAVISLGALLGAVIGALNLLF